MDKEDGFCLFKQWKPLNSSLNDRRNSPSQGSVRGSPVSHVRTATLPLPQHRLCPLCHTSALNPSCLSRLPSYTLLSLPVPHDFSPILLGSPATMHTYDFPPPELPYLHNGPFSRGKNESLFSCLLLVRPGSLREPMKIDGLSSTLLSGSIQSQVSASHVFGFPPVSFCFLAWFTHQHVSSTFRLGFNGLHGAISQMTEIFCCHNC
jgi:hypothetical protein